MASDARPPRILQIAHNHPRFHAGGTELVALALHRQALEEGIDSWYLGALDGTQTRPNAGTSMIALSPDQREAAIFCETFNRFSLRQDLHFGPLFELKAFLEEIRPDVVHVHHVLNFGLEALHLIRKTLPAARIVLSAHDFYLICASNGQLYKHDTKERCAGPRLEACLKCFPNRSPNDFALRALDIRSALSVCDQLLAPSLFLKHKLERSLGLERPIEVVENGYIGPAEIASPPPSVAGPFTFGYFGNISAIKGLPDLLDAADMLLARGSEDFRLLVHGSQLFEDKALFDRMAAARQTLGDRISFFGAYAPEAFANLVAPVDCMVFPSVWWENAPLVVYQALHHRRQVIAYPHGGAPEILARYGTGLLAERSDARALADVMASVLADRSLARVDGRPVPGRQALLDAHRPSYFG
jgi:glycosyltransferase involved in cell wall biosynthesis